MAFFSEQELSSMSAPAKVLEHLQLTDLALEKAASAELAQQKVAAEISQLIPTAVDSLIADSFIPEKHRTKAASVLADPVETMKLLIKLARHQATPVATGGPSLAKAASAGVPAISEMDQRFLSFFDATKKPD